jgi:NADPH2:quinone reductase
VLVGGAGASETPRSSRALGGRDRDRHRQRRQGEARHWPLAHRVSTTGWRLPIREVAPDGVDLIVEVAPGANAELDQAVLRPRGTISIYANDGGAPFTLDVRRNMGLNARYQFVLLYTVGWERIAAAAADVNVAIAAGGYDVGEQAGLPLHRFPLEDARAAHEAVESGVVGKVLVTVSPDA